MNRNNQLWLLEAEEELQRLQDLSATLPQDAPSQLLRLMLQQVEYLIAEAERIAAMTEGAAEPPAMVGRMAAQAGAQLTRSASRLVSGVRSSRTCRNEAAG